MDWLEVLTDSGSSLIPPPSKCFFSWGLGGRDLFHDNWPFLNWSVPAHSEKGTKLWQKIFSLKPKNGLTLMAFFPEPRPASFNATPATREPPESSRLAEEVLDPPAQPDPDPGSA